MKYEIGARIRAFREARGLTQKELADRLQINNNRVSNWEQGINRPDADMLAARPAGIPLVAPQRAGMLETNVVRTFDPQRPFYDSTGRSVVLLSRTATGFPDIGVLLRGYEREDGSLAIGRWHKNDGEVYFVHIPGGDLKFHLVYDPEMQLYFVEKC